MTKNTFKEALYEEREVAGPDKYDAIKAAISKWSDSIPNHDLTSFGDKIQIQSVYERPAYLLMLQTQYETRTLEKGNEPYHGEPVQPLSVSENDVDVWTFSAPQVKDFSIEENQYIIDGSREVLECPTCDGEGAIICAVCKGSKVNTCSDCSGKGKVKCSKCSGKGEIKCSLCYGKGEISSGNKKKKCLRCGGLGHNPCPSCKSGFNTCRGCKGKGQVDCRKCSGRGAVVCTQCGGEKRIVSYLYLQDTFKPGLISIMVTHANVPFKLVDSSIVVGDSKEIHVDDILTTEPVVDIVQAEIDEDLHKSIDHQKVVVEFLTMSSQSRSVNGLVLKEDTRIIQQRFAIYKINTLTVDYTYAEKKYSLLLYGLREDKIFATTSPIHEIGDNYYVKAGNAFENKDYRQALDLVEKAVSISANNDEAVKLKNKVLTRIYRTNMICSIIGAVTVPTFYYAVSWMRDMHRVQSLWDALLAVLFFSASVVIGAVVAESRKDKATSAKSNIKRCIYATLNGALSMYALIMLYQIFLMLIGKK